MAPTVGGTLELEAGQFIAELDLRRNALLLKRGDRLVEVTGACIRALAPYERARRDTADGWRSAADAWCSWVELGGSPDSPVDAVAWDRSRLRRLLDPAGVTGLDALVERKKLGNYVQTRLGLAIARIVLNM